LEVAVIVEITNPEIILVTYKYFTGFTLGAGLKVAK
jgi:hypothetical protein